MYICTIYLICKLVSVQCDCLVKLCKGIIVCLRIIKIDTLESG